MKHKPIKIDWDQLEEAFSNPQEEAEAYLDRVTGRVVLGGEGGDLSEDDDDVLGRAGASVRENPTHLPIHPPDLDVKIDWLRAFLAQGHEDQDPAALAALVEAVDAEDPVQEIAEVLKGHPTLRDAWYLFRSERIQELIAEWLEAHGVSVVEPPPWG